MSRFRTDPDKFALVRSRTIVKLTPLLALLPQGVLAWLAFAPHIRTSTWTLLLILAVSALVFIAISTITFCLVLRSQKLAYDSFELEIGAAKVIRRQAAARNVEIPANDLRHIIEYPNGAFLVQGKQILQRIVVPPGLEGRPHARELLAELAPIESKALPSALRMTLTLTLITTAPLLAFYLRSGSVGLWFIGSALMMLALILVIIIRFGDLFQRRVRRLLYVFLTALILAIACGMLLYPR